MKKGLYLLYVHCVNYDPHSEYFHFWVLGIPMKQSFRYIINWIVRKRAQEILPAFIYLFYRLHPDKSKKSSIIDLQKLPFLYNLKKKATFVCRVNSLKSTHRLVSRTLLGCAFEINIWRKKAGVVCGRNLLLTTTCSTLQNGNEL